MKCQRCKKDKPPEDFYWRDRLRKDGTTHREIISPKCRKCHNIRKYKKPEETWTQRLLRKDLEKKANALLVGE